MIVISCINNKVTNTPDHIKTYRPKLLVLTGDPRTRSALVDFATYITKDLSLIIFGHVIQEDIEHANILVKLKEDVQQWLKENRVPGFYSVTQNFSLKEGTWNLMTLTGLGKLSPNMVLMGFKNNWKDDLDSLDGYLEILFSAFDLHLSSAIIRSKMGFEIFDSETVKTESNNNTDTKDESPQRKDVETGAHNETEQETSDSSTFHHFPSVRREAGNVDVWWLFDDGGLSLLIPHLVTLHKKWKNS